MTLIRLNKTKFLKHVLVEVNKELDIVAERLVEFMVFEIASIPYSGSVEAVGKPEWRDDVMEAIKFKTRHEVGKALIRRIGVFNQSDDIIMKSMIVEFGMGDLTNISDNPWIKDYFSSEYYHAERGSMSVYGRKGKKVYNIDTNSWEDSTAQHTDEIQHFHQVGSGFWSNIFGSASTLAQIELDMALERAFSRINISQFVTSTIKKGQK